MQFRFVQLQHPGIVIAFEKMLMAGCLPVAAAVVTWGVAAGTGMSNACFFLAALMCGLYYLFGLPLPSSFHLGGRGRIAMGEPARQRATGLCRGADWRAQQPGHLQTAHGLTFRVGAVAAVVGGHCGASRARRPRRSHKLLRRALHRHAVLA